MATWHQLDSGNGIPSPPSVPPLPVSSVLCSFYLASSVWSPSRGAGCHPVLELVITCLICLIYGVVKFYRLPSVLSCLVSSVTHSRGADCHIAFEFVISCHTSLMCEVGENLSPRVSVLSRLVCLITSTRHQFSHSL